MTGYVDWHGFDKTFALLQVEGQTVIDIGPGWADSIQYWLDHGAALVYAYEIDPEEVRKLQEAHGDDDRVILFADGWHGEELPPATLLKCDIEGDEKYLTADVIEQYPQWCIAIHDWGTYHMRDMLTALGGILCFVSPDQHEEVYVKSL